VGLFVYDFGDHVSVGYTAEEINVLLASPEHSGGTAYRIHRVDEAARIELEAMPTGRIDRPEAMAFASAQRSVAQGDFETLRTAGEATPLPCPVELTMARLNDPHLPFAVMLSYPAYASSLLSKWLLDISFSGGEDATGGVGALERFQAASTGTILHCELPVDPGFVSRSVKDVLATTDQPVQR
jgi:hypothetical protein